MDKEHNLAEILRIAFSETIVSENILHSFEPYLGDGIKIIKCKKGQFMIHTGQNIHKVYILLSGNCYIFKYSAEGKCVMSGNCKSPQILGLFELLNGVPAHTATIENTTPCILIEVPKELYINRIKIDKQVMWHSLLFLASFINQILTQSDKMMLNTPRQNLLLYFYEKFDHYSFPIYVDVDKVDMAEELNINLRTLYRKLRILREQGIIVGKHGKIVIDENNLKKIWEEIKDLI